MQSDCIESAIPLQSPGLQKIVPALPRFRVDRTLIPDRLRMDADSGCNWGCLLAICGFAKILVKSFKSPGNPSRFRNLTAIKFDCDDCGQDCRPGIFGRFFAGSGWVDSSRISVRLKCWRNPSQLHQDRSKSIIQSQLSGLQISRARLREDCDNSKELVLGIAGHREDCRGSPSNCLGLPSSLGSDLTDSR